VELYFLPTTRLDGDAFARATQGKFVLLVMALVLAVFAS
jgi:hypothetical protein